MQNRKNRPTPRRTPLKPITIDTAIMTVFDEGLRRHVNLRDWAAVERDFNWLGHYMENQDAARQ